MSILTLDGQLVTRFDDPDRKVRWAHLTSGGHSVLGSLRSIAHLDQTSAAAMAHFGSPVVVIQSAYNTGVPASAGTHDKDAVYDVMIPGVDWREAERFFRAHGWAAWFRFPPAFGEHIHMVSLGYTMPVGIFVPGQVVDYYNHALGLAGQHNSGSDPTWHPRDIDATIFDFAEWRREMEEDMGYSDWSKADKAALLGDLRDVIVPATANAVMAELVAHEPDVTVRAALRRASGTPELVHRVGDVIRKGVVDDLMEKLDKDEGR